MDVMLPEYLYKYHPLESKFEEMIVRDGVQLPKTGIDALEDMLLLGKIYYSKPYYFNDPFELDGVRLRISAGEKEQGINRTILYLRKNRPPGYSAAEISREVRKNKERMYAEIQEELDGDKNTLLHRCGYICLCESDAELLMWSHYGDKHRGVCLRFKTEVDSFFIDERGRGRVVRVNYDDKITEKEIAIDAVNDAVFLKISQKAKCWEYEKEYRVFRYPSTPKADDASGNHDFDSSIIDGLCFGLETPDENEKKILEIVNSAKHEISLFRVQKSPDVLGISIVPFSKQTSGSALFEIAQ